MIKKGLVLICFLFLWILIIGLNSVSAISPECQTCLDSCGLGERENSFVSHCLAVCYNPMTLNGEAGTISYCLTNTDCPRCYELLTGYISPLCFSNNDCPGENNLCDNGRCVSYPYTTNEETVTSHSLYNLYKYNYAYPYIADGPVAYCCAINDNIGPNNNRLATCIEEFAAIDFPDQIDSSSIYSFLAFHSPQDVDLAQCLSFNVGNPLCQPYFDFNDGSQSNWAHCSIFAYPINPLGSCVNQGHPWFQPNGGGTRIQLNGGGVQECVSLGFSILTGSDQLTFFRDADGDGRGNPGNFIKGYAMPSGYTTNFADCNDNDNTVYWTGNNEVNICDLKDNDCDGRIDEGCPGRTYYLDGDGDNYGTTSLITTSVTPPSGYGIYPNDCDDTNSNINPGRTEICGNAVDEDCSGVANLCDRGSVCNSTNQCVSGLECVSGLCGCPIGTTFDGMTCVVVGTPELLWMDSTRTINFTGTTQTMGEWIITNVVYRNSNLSLPQTFTIRESDGIFGSMQIATFSATQSGNELFATFEINESVIRLARDFLEGNTYEFYFTINGKESGILNIFAGDLPELHWRDSNGNIIIEKTYTLDDILNTGIPLTMYFIRGIGGETFELEELTGTNTNLGSFNAINVNSSAYDWTLTCEGLARAGGGRNYEFRFNVGGENSQVLRVNLDRNAPNDPANCDVLGDEIYPNATICRDYITQASCNADPRRIAPSEMICAWVQNQCVSQRVVIVGGTDIGTCSYFENTADNCDDGYLTYSWTARWDWAPENTARNDPGNDEAKCVNGETTIVCPAHIQLDFFTIKNLIAALLLIVIIYLIIKNFKRKSVNEKVPVSKKKTAVKKKVVRRKK